MVTGKLEDQLEALRDISAEEAQTTINKNRKGFEDAEEILGDWRKTQEGLAKNNLLGIPIANVGDEAKESIKSTLEGLGIQFEEDDFYIKLKFDGSTEEAQKVFNDAITQLEDIGTPLAKDIIDNALTPAF